MFALIILLPVLILVLATLWIVILQQTRPSIGYSWLIAALGGLLTMGIVLALRWRLPMELQLSQWNPYGDTSSPPSFLLDASSWPFAFCLVVIALASILTDSARLGGEAKPSDWAAGLGLTALGLLAIFSNNPITLVATWTAVDLVEFLLLLISDAGRRLGQRIVTAFSVRVTSQLIVILALLYAGSLGVPFTMDSIPSEIALLMLLAVSLRLGVLPLNLPYSREIYSNRGLGNTARMVGVSTSLVILGKMPEVVASVEWTPLLLGLTGLTAVYGGVMWLVAENAQTGRPYWSISLASLAIASVLNGSSRASIVWGVALLLVGSILFLYTAHRRGNPTIPIIGLIGLIGLPFTPAAGGWIGIMSGRITLASLLFLLTIIALIWGYLRHTFHPRDELHHMERWVHAVYPTGLVFIVAAQWIITLLGAAGPLTLGVWWASVVVFILAGSGISVIYFNRSLIDVGRNSWILATVRRIGAGTGSFFRLDWLINFFAWVYRAVQTMVQLVSVIFEGDGGFLWSLVFLALLITLISSGGNP